MPGLGVVLERSFVLAQQAVSIATDLSRRGLVLLVAVRVRDGNCFVRSA